MLKNTNGITSYINSQLKPNLLLTDEHDRCIQLKMKYRGTKFIILGLHVANEDKMKLFNLIDQLTMFSYENWCLMRDCNRIVTPQFDRTSDKN